MCGIVGFTSKNNVSEFLLEGLSKLEYRGYDSAGIAVFDGSEIKIEKTVKRISDLYDRTSGGQKLIGNIGIGHTRWATHGAPSERNAHPHTSENSLFAVVHNGIIENYAELKAELIAEGVVFNSDTDTEVVPHLLSKYYKGDLKEAVRKTEERLEGSYALGIICKDFPDTLTAVKNFSPLIIGVAEEGNIIASDVTAVISKTRDIIYLEDGDTAFLTKNGIEIENCGKTAQRPLKKVNWDISAAEKGGYDHFMLKEITEQPRAIAQTVESRIKDGEINFEEISLNSDRLKKIRNINIIACGSAYHAGMVGKYVFEEMLRIPTNVDIASEFRYRNPIVDSNSLTIIISQSGETADTLAALKEAKNRGSHILSIVNVVGSTIAKESDDVIYTWAGPEIAVATTKGFTTQLSVLYMFAIWAAKRLGTMEKSELESVYNDLVKLPEKIEKIIEQKEKIAELAKDCTKDESLFFIGRNMDYAVSLEASLKLKEISYIHSEAYAAGELKHGTISLIEQDRKVIALACCEGFYDKMMSNIKEVKARGAFVLACTNEGNTKIEAEAEQVIYVPKVHTLLTAAVEVIPFQLYSYYVALYKGCDIDKPRNLAKSVTVE